MIPFTLRITAPNSEVADLCSLYWELSEDHHTFLHPVALLAERYDLTIYQAYTLVQKHCEAESTFINCPDCAAPYVFANRHDYTQRKPVRSVRSGLRCPKCTARVAESVQERSMMQSQQQGIIEEQRRVQLRAIFDSYKARPMSLPELPLEVAIGLLAAIRVGGDEDLSYLVPLRRFTQTLSPGGKDDIAILSSLYKAGVLLPSAESPGSAFEWSNGELKAFATAAVMWIWPAGDGTTLSDAHDELEWYLSDRTRWPDRWDAEIHELSRKVAVDECVEYLIISLKDHKLDFTPGPKTTSVIHRLLDDFSIGQVHNMTWRAARDSAAYSVRAGVARSQAANSALGRIQRFGESALANRWEVKAFRPDRRCPQSMVSQILFQKALRIGDTYLTTRLDDMFDATFVSPNRSPVDSGPSGE